MRYTFAMVVGITALCCAVPPSLAQAPPADASSQAEALYKAKDYDKAIAAYQAILTSSAAAPVRAKAQLGVGQSLFRKKDYAAAKLAYLRTADQFPDQPEQACEALFRAANLISMEKDVDATIAAYSRAAKAHGGVAAARTFAAQAQVRVGQCYLVRRVEGKRQLSKAVAAYQAAIDNFPEQSDTVSEAKLQLVALKLEYAINNKATFAEAQKDAETYLATNPTPNRTATARIVRAEALFHQAKYDDAIAEIGVIQSKYADAAKPSGTSQFLLAKCYDGKGDYERAIKEYGTFLSAISDSFSAWEERPGAQFGIGTCLRALGRADEAAAAFAKLKTDYPNSYFVKLVGEVAQ